MINLPLFKYILESTSVVTNATFTIKCNVGFMYNWLRIRGNALLDVSALNSVKLE